MGALLLGLCALAAAPPPQSAPSPVVEWSAPLLSELGFPTVADDGTLIDLEVLADPELPAKPRPAPPKRRFFSLADRCGDGVTQTELRGDALVVLCIVHAHEEGPSSRHEQRPSTLTSISLRSGKRTWSIDLPTTEGQLGCDASTCVLQTMTWLAAYDLSHGRRLWNTGGMGDAVVGDTITFEEVRLGKDVTVVTTSSDSGEAKLAAFRTRTGKVVWTAPAAPDEHLLGIDAERLVTAQSVSQRGADGGRYPSAWKVSTYAVGTGALGWQRVVEVAPDSAKAAIDQGTVLLEDGERAIALSTHDGTERWRSPLRPATTTAVTPDVTEARLAPGLALAWAVRPGASSPTLEGLDLATGQPRWTWDPPPAGDGFSPQIHAVNGNQAVIVSGNRLTGLSFKP